MRVPKFRAWLKDEQRMVDVYEMTFLDDEIILLSYDMDFYTDDEFKLMQYTELHDVHGKEVFEDDIVKIPEDYDKFGRNAGEILKVAFDKGCFRLKRPNSKGRGFYFEDDNTVEIIGNIYENPELLEEI